jgi:hypothetical protein
MTPYPRRTSIHLRRTENTFNQHTPKPRQEGGRAPAGALPRICATAPGFAGLADIVKGLIASSHCDPLAVGAEKV